MNARPMVDRIKLDDDNQAIAELPERRRKMSVASDVMISKFLRQMSEEQTQALRMQLSTTIVSADLPTCRTRSGESWSTPAPSTMCANLFDRLVQFTLAWSSCTGRGGRLWDAERRWSADTCGRLTGR